MKFKTNILLIILALLIYCSGLCTASAFYDPGAQRWVNRDPFEEIGFTIKQNRWVYLPLNEEFSNMYIFIRNEPIDYFDYFGLTSLLYYVGCFNKEVNPTPEKQCTCLCVGTTDNECYNTCVSCQDIKNPRKVCECIMHARQDATGGEPNDYQIKQTCDKFPDVDVPCPKPKPSPGKPLPPISIPIPPSKSPGPKPPIHRIP